MDEEYTKLARARWEHSQRRASVEGTTTVSTIRPSTTIHTSTPSPSFSARTSAPSLSSVITSASFPTVSDRSESAVSSSNLLNVYANPVSKQLSTFVDTSGDLELARKFEAEEKNFLAQTQRDEEFARQMQDSIDHDEEIARGILEEEENNKTLSHHEREQVHEGSDSDEENELHRGAELPHASHRLGAPFGARGDLEELFRLMGLEAPSGSVGGPENGRRVQFANFDHFIRNQIAEAEDADDYQGGISSAVLQQLPTRIYTKPAGASSSCQQNCSICLSEFVEGDKLRSLPCFHSFHEAEIDQWLGTNNSCPICKTIVQV